MDQFGYALAGTQEISRHWRKLPGLTKDQSWTRRGNEFRHWRCFFQRAAGKVRSRYMTISSTIYPSGQVRWYLFRLLYWGERIDNKWRDLVSHRLFFPMGWKESWLPYRWGTEMALRMMYWIERPALVELPWQPHMWLIPPPPLFRGVYIYAHYIPLPDTLTITKKRKATSLITPAR